MSCFFCKGTLSESVTAHMIELPHCVLVVKNVPCRRCSQCGEVVLDSDVIEELDILASKFEGSTTEIAVVNYMQKTA